MTKAELRLTMKELRSSLTREERLSYGESIRRRLTRLKVWDQCNQLFTYLSFGTEVDTWGLVEEVLSDSCVNNGHEGEAFSYDPGKYKEVFIPRVEGTAMNFYHITETISLKRSKFGVLEPDESHLIPYTSERLGSYDNRSEDMLSSLGPKEAVRLMLLPGLAFDLKGNRLGYGAGYYDRYLSEHSNDGFIKVALAYELQVFESINAEAYDIRVDYIVTPERIITCRTQPIKDDI